MPRPIVQFGLAELIEWPVEDQQVEMRGVAWLGELEQAEREMPLIVLHCCPGRLWLWALSLL